MISVLKFYLKRIYIWLYILLKKLTNNQWQKVEGVYLPLWKEIGFNTLRWIVDRQYEQDEIRIIKAKLIKADRVLEIGTGLGFVSTYCANIIGSENVYTFEANPLNVQIANKVFAKNKVQPFLTNALLDREKGVANFPINKKSRLASSLSDTKNDFVEVEKLKLNNVVNRIKPNFLIMDIEGGEYDIITNLQFHNINKIQFELHPKILGGKKCDEIHYILLTNGFQKDSSVSRNDNFFYYKNVSS